jgi:hypothetical protein
MYAGLGDRETPCAKRRAIELEGDDTYFALLPRRY